MMRVAFFPPAGGPWDPDRWDAVIQESVVITFTFDQDYGSSLSRFGEAVDAIEVRSTVLPPAETIAFERD
jgi:hypothetical protein